MVTETANLNLNDQAIISLWRKYTIQTDSLDADFFECGGDSLSAINLIVELQKSFQVEVSLENFLRNPTMQFLQKIIMGR